MRKEIKYNIDYKDYINITRILQKILILDKHIKNRNTYIIRTIYFDNYLHKIQNEKKNDINNVGKYRIRMYDNKKCDIFLERKNNNNGIIVKRKEKIEYADVINILKGNYANILSEKKSLKTELYLKIILEQLRPVLLIEYEREAFEDEVSYTRITLDRNLKSVTDCKKFFENDIRVIKENKDFILEIKYEKFLPDYIKDLITYIDKKNIAKSKFIREIEEKNEF